MVVISNVNHATILFSVLAALTCEARDGPPMMECKCPRCIGHRYFSKTSGIYMLVVSGLLISESDI